MFEIQLPPAIDAGSAVCLLAQVQEAVDDSRQGAIVFSGADGVFCEGVDLKPLASSKPAHDMIANAVDAFARCLELMRGSPKPTMALVDGAARGGGVGLAAACDVVVATETSSFALPELLWGLLPAVIYPAVRERMSLQQFRLWALTGCGFTADAARDAGLVDVVIPPGELERQSREWRKRLSRAGPEPVTSLRKFLAECPADGEARVRRGIAMTTEALADERLHASLRQFYADGQAPWDQL